jgi:hypothetical protein
LDWESFNLQPRSGGGNWQEVQETARCCLVRAAYALAGANPAMKSEKIQGQTRQPGRSIALALPARIIR